MFLSHLNDTSDCSRECFAGFAITADRFEVFENDVLIARLCS